MKNIDEVLKEIGITDEEERNSLKSLLKLLVTSLDTKKAKSEKGSRQSSHVENKKGVSRGEDEECIEVDVSYKADTSSGTLDIVFNVRSVCRRALFLKEIKGFNELLMYFKYKKNNNNAESGMFIGASLILNQLLEPNKSARIHVGFKRRAKLRETLKIPLTFTLNYSVANTRKLMNSSASVTIIWQGEREPDRGTSEDREKIDTDLIITPIVSGDELTLNFLIPNLALPYTPKVTVSKEKLNELINRLWEEIDNKLSNSTLPYTLVAGWGNQLFGELGLTELFSSIQSYITLRNIIINIGDKFATRIPWEMISDDGETIISTKVPLGRRVEVRAETFMRGLTEPYKIWKRKMKIGVIISFIREKDIDAMKKSIREFFEMSKDYEDIQYEKHMMEELNFFLNFSRTSLRDIADIEILVIRRYNRKLEIAQYKNGEEIYRKDLFGESINEYNRILTENQEEITQKNILDPGNEDILEVVFDNTLSKIKTQVDAFIAKKYDILHLAGEGGELRTEDNKNVLVLLITPSPDTDDQLTPSKLIDARKGHNQPLFLLYGNFCWSSHIGPSIDESQGEKAFFEKVKYYFPKGSLTVALNHIGPSYFISTRAAPIFSCLFYANLLRKLQKEGKVAIGEILQKTKETLSKIHKLHKEDNSIIRRWDITWMWLALFGDPRSTISIIK